MPRSPKHAYVFSTPIVFVCALFVVTTLRGDLIETFSVGQGNESAEIQFDFINGNTYVYNIHFNGDGITGRDVFDVILNAQPEFFNFQIQVYDWGQFLTGVFIGNDADTGDGSEPPYLNYWHYWTAEFENSWEYSMIGFTDRLLENGSRDAWVFGTDVAPAVIPAPATIFALSFLLTLPRTRRRV
jgi:hypothetical protein